MREHSVEAAAASQLTLYYVSYLMALGRCARVRQRAINTAALLFRRFYKERVLASHDPLLVAPTVLMMASKMEECYVAAAVLVRAMPRLETELGCKNPYGVLHILEQVRSRAKLGLVAAHVAGGRATPTTLLLARPERTPASPKSLLTCASGRARRRRRCWRRSNASSTLATRAPQSRTS
jgi:hypothetical protein